MRCRETTFGGLRLERVRASKQFDGSTFKNPTGRGPGLKGNPLPVLGEYFFGGGQRVPPGPLPLVRPHESWQRRAGRGLRVTWLGHSTTLLEMDGFAVLTDPVFAERASPVRFAGPKRFHPVPASLDELPPLDAVVLSHDHYDHLCAPTMRALAATDVPIVTSLGVGARLEALGVSHERVHELDWGEHVDVRGVRFTATPCQHFSGRGPGDGNKTLWSSWVIETERHKVFFSGDTGLTDAFETTGARHGPFDLVMLEVGAYHESWGDIHLGPDNALKAFEMLGGGTLLPVHWGTFNLALHDWDDPAETLVQLAAERRLRVVTPMLGEVLVPDHVDGPSPWWKDVRKI
ncbi:MAG: MBL fold metallo-hydrolase [Myxococcales bacterium]|nr:MBL fold metallo-hydrolase [Myxococcales bacterium]